MKNIFLLYFFFCTGCNLFSDNDPAAHKEDNEKTLIPGKLVIQVKDRMDSVKSTARFTRNKPDTGFGNFPEQLVAYAKTLTGTAYKYASVNPADGLDCSGFITHVFNHFAIQVPRSSVDFTNYGVTINEADAQPGDLILFTGTDSSSTVVGHMGIITGKTNGEINFIHSTSGKAYGVTSTALNKYYRKRFVKVIRIPFYSIKNVNGLQPL